MADTLRQSFKSGSTLIKLIYINIAVFIVISLASIAGFLLNNEVIAVKALNLFSVPSSLKTLVFRPWTVITYMFTHKDILHILFNMLWLYWFGLIFMEYLGARKLVPVYILGGIGGAIVYIVSFNIFPAFSQVVHESVAIGASASVMAVVIATATYVPDYTIGLLLIGRVKIKWVALGIFILTSFMDFSVNSGGKLAHMGGALFGYLYIINLRKGRDAGRMVAKITDFFSTFFKPSGKMKVTYRKPATDYDYNKAKAERQKAIDLILDKIAKGGYDSLTKEEKDLLFRESQKKN
ncbi:MAG: rhomboid family intramembrane serine protease [Bacteroidales bacterium]|nr:rhomboid family intramembrane serine protease [Bacteroidales bacterium]